MTPDVHSMDTFRGDPASEITESPVRLTPLISWLFGVGVGAAVAGVLLDLFLRFSGSTSKPVVSLKDLLFPNAETNLFSWYSATVLAAVAIGFGVHAFIAKKGSRLFGPFVVLAATALLMSADEAAMLHERLDGLAAWLGLSISWGYQWIVIGIPIAVVAGIGLLWLARALDPLLRRRLVFAGVVFLLGAIGGELLGGMITKIDLGLSNDASYVVHSAAILVEETLEISGALLALRAALLHLRLRRGPAGLVLTNS